MTKILDEIRNMSLVRNLFVGGLFSAELTMFTEFGFTSFYIIQDIMVFYLLGLMLSRIEVYITYPLLKKIKIVKYPGDEDLRKIFETDSDIKRIYDVDNVYRGIVSSQIVYITFLAMAELISGESHRYSSWLIPLGILLLFLYSSKKQASMINNKVEEAMIRTAS